VKQFLIKHKWKIIFASAGLIAGYAYYYFVGCASGSCPIQSKWYLSTLYGGIIGYLLAGLITSRNNKNKNETI